MDIIAISGSALQLKTAQTQQSLAVSIIKQAADQQNQIANLLAQNARNNQRLVPQNSDSTFSIYV